MGEEEFDRCFAADGEEALQLARDWQPHLVLLDVSLPKLTGFDVCRELKADPATEGIGTPKPRH